MFHQRTATWHLSTIPSVMPQSPHSRSICHHKIHTRPFCGGRCRLEGLLNLLRGIHKKGAFVQDTSTDNGVFSKMPKLGGGTPTLWGKWTSRRRAISWSGSKRGRCRRYLTGMDGIHSLWRIQTIKLCVIGHQNCRFAVRDSSLRRRQGMGTVHVLLLCCERQRQVRNCWSIIWSLRRRVRLGGWSLVWVR
jgi:hypothetical protein